MNFDPAWLVLISVLIGLAYWLPVASMLDAPSRLRRSQLLFDEETLLEAYPDFIYAPLMPVQLDFLGSTIARVGIDRECQGTFELTENGVRGVATDCKFRFKFGRRSPIWLQTVLEIRIPGETLPFFRAHPQSDLSSQLMEFDRVETKTILDLTHQCECLDRNQIIALFENSNPADSELAWLGSARYSIECDRDRILIYQLRKIVPPKMLPEFIRSGVRLAIKIYALDQLRKWLAQGRTCRDYLKATETNTSS